MDRKCFQSPEKGWILKKSKNLWEGNKIKQFNLVVSTGRDFETQAENELWFNLMALGDESPLIYNSGIQGLVLAKTTLPPRKLINYLNEIHRNKDKNYAQFLHKIYPVDAVVPTELEQMRIKAIELVKQSQLSQNPDSRFRITIRKRVCSLRTNEIIPAIADSIPNKVSLQDYDWNLQLEIIGDSTGMSILGPDDVFAPLQQEISVSKESPIDLGNL
jgi:tRNA acetyltransferase TAN1